MKDAALWINDAILFGTAILVWRYVTATNKLVRNSQQTVDLTQRMFEASQRPYVGVSSSRLENLIQPLPLSTWRCYLTLKNFGNAPAIDVRLDWRLRVSGSVAIDEHPAEPVFVLQPGQEQLFLCTFTEAANLSGELSRDAAALEIVVEVRYKGLAGNEYRYYEKSRFDPRMQLLTVVETAC